MITSTSQWKLSNYCIIHYCIPDLRLIYAFIVYCFHFGDDEMSPC